MDDSELHRLQGTSTTSTRTPFVQGADESEDFPQALVDVDFRSSNRIGRNRRVPTPNFGWLPADRRRNNFGNMTKMSQLLAKS